jgi:hypothetical protein
MAVHTRIIKAPDSIIVGYPSLNGAGISTAVHDAVYRKIGWRLPPFLLACYIINYLDRGLSGPALAGWLYETIGRIYVGYATAILISALLATFALPHARTRKPGLAKVVA